jgi:LPXTG-motif cell wall-anchored protein
MYKRLGAALSATMLVLVSAAAGTAYAETKPSFTAGFSSMTESIGPPGSVTKGLAFSYSSRGGPVNPKITIDTSKAAGVLILAPGSGNHECKASGANFTCTASPVDYSGSLAFVVRTAPGAKIGDQARIIVTADADNTDPQTVTTLLTVRDRADLVTVDRTEPEISRPVKRREVLHQPGSFVNAGSRPAPQSDFVWFVDKGLTPAEYTGCTYARWASKTRVVCPFDGALAPGEGVKFVTVNADGTEHDGFDITANADANGYAGQGFQAHTAGEPLPNGAGELLDEHTATTGKRYKTVRIKPAQVNGADANLQYWFVIVGGYDIAATGSRATGQPGDVVKVNVGVKNVGTAAVHAPHDYYVRAAWTYTFTPPPGTEVVTAPADCTPFTPPAGRPYYRCQNLAVDFKPGDAQTLEFALRITQLLQDATGVVTFPDQYVDPHTHAYPSFDLNPANDRATVVINALNPTAGPSHPGEALPVTGTRTSLVAATGAVLLAGGVALFLIARRRRVVLVSPPDGADNGQ